MHKRIFLFIFIVACVAVISSGPAAAISTNNTTTSQAALNNTTNQTSANASSAGDNSQVTSNSILNNQTKVSYTTIQAAINAASAGNTLIINPGTYAENVNINKNINLIGSGENSTIIDGRQYVVIQLPNSNTVTISDLSIMNGYLFSMGGGIWNNGGNLILTNVKITNCTTSLGGGGIYNGGTLTINNSIINGCTSSSTSSIGGGICNDRTLTINNSIINGCTADIGGGIWNGGTLTLYNSSITKNTAGNGGGIYTDGTLTSTNCNYTNDTASNGGAIYNENGAFLTVRSCIFNDNPGTGGDIYFSSGSIILTNNTFQGNTATLQDLIANAPTGSIINLRSGTFTGYGNYNLILNKNLILTGSNSASNPTIINANQQGLIFSIIPGIQITLTDLTLTNGKNGAGGGIYNNGTLTINNSSITKNTADNGGGGGIFSVGTLTIYNSIITNNTAIGGGGIWSYGPVNIYNSIITNNTATSSSSSGGGIFYGWNPTNFNIINCTFSDNSAFNGGAISNQGNTLNIINSSFTNNRALYSASKNIVYGGRGGVVSGYGNFNVTDCIFKNNTAMFGGVFNVQTNSNLTAANCTFTNNTVTAVDTNGNPIVVVTYKVTENFIYEFTQAELQFISGVSQFLFTTNPVKGISDILTSVHNILGMFSTTSNTVEAAGGAIYMLQGSNLNMINCNLANNTAAVGGGICNFGNGTVTIKSTSFVNNPAGMGGAIYCNDLSPLDVTYSNFTGNTAYTGGAISYIGQTSGIGSIHVNYNTFLGNSASLGALLYDDYNNPSYITMDYNIIYGAGSYDIFNEMGNIGKITAQYNWWGTNSGPDVNMTSSGNVFTDPYIILTVTANPNQPSVPKTVQYGGSTPVTADFLHDSYYDISNPDKSKIDPQDVKLLDGIPVTFTVVNGGTITPITGYISNGTVNVTYIANGTIDTTQLVKIYANAEQIKPDTVSTLINVTKMPTRITMNPVSGLAGQEVNLTARVVDNNGVNISGGAVTFSVGTADTVTAPVVNGYATYNNWTIPSQWPPDTYNIIADYNGTNIYTSKETQTTLTVDNTLSKGLLLTASARVKEFIETNNRLPNYVTIHNQKLTMPQFLELLTTLTLQINQGNLKPITIKTVNPAPNPNGINSPGNIYKTEYINIAQRIQNFINKYGRTPNYANTSLGTIQFTKLLYIYSKIIYFYGTHDRLPNYVMTN